VFLLLSEILQQIDCRLISEDINQVSILLRERHEDRLQGTLLYGEKKIGVFKTQKPTVNKNSTWHFEMDENHASGEIVLFKNYKLWHKLQSEVLSKEVNRALFVGLTSSLELISSDKKLLKASSGFFKIGNGCYGGKIKKV